jgi:polyhydroxyalkanoate synthesis regulator protein
MNMMAMPPIKAIEEQTRRNMELFQNAMRMFTAFPTGTTQPEPPEAPAKTGADDLSEMKNQIAAMQKKLDEMNR